MSISKSPEQMAADIELQRAKFDAQQKAEEALAKRLIPLIEAKDVYYVGQQHLYMMYDKQLGWKSFAPEAIAKLFALIKAYEKQVFDECLRKLDRVKETTVITFNQAPKDALNFLSVDDWLQPKEGPVHPIFDVLMDSLSGGKQENREHLEKCIVWKYRHPEDYQLPCITISGAGGAGKNELIEKVFATIFGSKQVIVLGTDDAFGQYNGQMIGKTIVFIDEAIVEKGDAENLKRKVGNKTISINEKYGLQGNYDNTPWYWLGGNGTNGAVMLANATTDRRYSVLTVKHSIMFWVAKYLNLEVLPKVGEVLPSSHPAVVWYRENEKKLSDPNEVAKWLMSISLRWWKEEFVPGSLHSEDYLNVVNSQKSSFDHTMEYVFDSGFFSHIEGKTLYRIYCAINKEETDKKGFTKQRNKFYTDAQVWIEKHHPEIMWKKVKIKVSSTTMTDFTSAWVFKLDIEGKTLVRNDDEYIRVDERGNDVVLELFEGKTVDTF